MQEYDESFFITKANKRGGVTWFILMIIVSVYYGIKVGTGKLDVRNRIFIVLFCYCVDLT